MKKLLNVSAVLLATLTLLSFGSSTAFAAGGSKYPLKSYEVDVDNSASLRRGAKTYVNYCMGCHSLEYVRYSSLADDLQIDAETIEKMLMFTGDSVNNNMDTVMPAERSKKWFGKTPPDLTLKVSERGADWMYTFLKTFYVDPESKTGVANALIGGGDPTKAQLAMPFVLWKLQGYQLPIIEEHDGKKTIIGFTIPEGGELTPEEYDLRMQDLTNFLTYVSEPGKAQRWRLGAWVLIFLVVFTIVAYLLKKEYWKDVQ